MNEPLSGLSAREVQERRERGEGGCAAEQITKSRGQIIRENLLTLFNFLNFAIAVLLFAVKAYSNMIFIAIILLNIVEYLFIFLWSLLFVIPGIIAAYRYRFALYDLYENPGIGVMEALEMSKQQTLGYKGQLFLLDLSYTGWYLLASLPALIQVGYIYAAVFQDPGYFLADPTRVYALSLPLPLPVQVLLGCLWPLAVALFYLPVYQCTELGYFDIAKHTSGVSLSGAGGPDQPDDGGGGGF